MNRRDFLKLSSAAGLALGSGGMLLSRAWADGEAIPPTTTTDYTGPLFVMVQATGGWDPTLLCDPKGNLNGSYAEGGILTAGNINYAPIGANADTFFQTHFDKMTVINGVDGGTNNHEAGRRHTASGRLGAGYPNLAALVAGASAPELPMAFLTFGGYERTQGVVAPVRDGNANRLAELAFPGRINASDEMSATYHSEAAQSIIANARDGRSQAMRSQMQLPRYQHTMDTMLTARVGSDQLKLLQEVLPAPNGDNNFRKCELICAAYKAGIGVAGNVSMGGFDTHNNHDANHIPRMNNLLGVVNFLWEEAARQEIADQLVVLITSDFGRTPNYNGDNGKDHWSITSMIAMGAGIPGNRVVGQTDDGHTPVMLDPSTLEPAADPEAEGATRIQPKHVHRALRKMMGVEGTDADAAFPLGDDTDDLPIFSA